MSGGSFMCMFKEKVNAVLAGLEFNKIVVPEMPEPEKFQTSVSMHHGRIFVGMIGMETFIDTSVFFSDTRT